MVDTAWPSRDVKVFYLRLSNKLKAPEVDDLQALVCLGWTCRWRLYRNHPVDQVARSWSMGNSDFFVLEAEVWCLEAWVIGGLNCRCATTPNTIGITDIKAGWVFTVVGSDYQSITSRWFQPLSDSDLRFEPKKLVSCNEGVRFVAKQLLQQTADCIDIGSG